MGMLAYRNYWAEEKSNFDGSCPEIIAPVTIHPAFDRAANYFGMKLIKLPVDPSTQKVSVSNIEAAISNKTVVVAVSAPQYPHGIYDPIEEVAKVCEKRKVFLHVDCCLGGFLNPFAEKAGFDIGTFDFRLKSVTSISADSHKYGCTPKGSSFSMFRSEQLRNYA